MLKNSLLCICEQQAEPDTYSHAGDHDGSIYEFCPGIWKWSGSRHGLLRDVFSDCGILSEFLPDHHGLGEAGISNLIQFMTVFGPIYFPAVAVAKGSVTAISFYSLTLFLVYLVEMFLKYVVLPAIHIYILVSMLNYLTKESYLSKLAELIKTVLVWIMKTILAGVVGLNLVQSLLSPAMDTVKRSALTRGTEAIPGIGDAIGGVTEVIFASAVLVKNGIGVVGAIICFALCLMPIVQIGAIALLYKLAAALMQPVSDVRIIGCMETVGEGMRLLIRAVFTVGMLFLITIILVAASTGTT